MHGAPGLTPGLRATLILVPAVLLTACTRPADSPAQSERVDSAGVEIVSSTDIDMSRLSVDPIPDLRIGGPDAVGPAQFGAVQAVSVASDGSIWVADRQSADIRVFASDGSHRTTIGGRGDGPGEFQVIRLLGQAGDSIAVVDDRSGRLSWFSLSGDLLTETRVARPEGTTPLVYVVRPDGGLAGANPLILPVGAAQSGDTLGGSVEFVVWQEPEEPPRVFASAPATKWLWTGTTQLPIPFTTNASLGVGDHLVVAGGPVPEVRYYSDTRLERIARVRRGVRPVDAAMRSQYSSFIRGVHPERRHREFLDVLDHPAVPDVAPAYARVLVDSEGLVWGQHFNADRRIQGDWDVFGVDGGFEGTVANPPGLWVQAIAEDSMVGVWLDDLDVSYLQRHRLSGR